MSSEGTVWIHRIHNREQWRSQANSDGVKQTRNKDSVSI